MTTNVTAAVLRTLVLPIFIVLLASPAAAQTVPGGYAKEGGFFGVTVLPAFTFDGETFDGQTAYKEIDGEELAFLPKMNKRPLIRAILGYRARQASLEISYDRTQHDGEFFGQEAFDSTFQAVNVDGRFFFNTSKRIQPHILVGGSFPWLNVEEGSFLDPDVGDARFKGYGVNTEAGVTMYATPQLGISVGYSFRMIWFDRVTGVSDTLGELRPRFRETAGTVSVTGVYVF